MDKTMAAYCRTFEKDSTMDRKSLSRTHNTKEHLKVWREIYQDVRRQWAEAEMNRPGRYRYGN